MSWSRSSKLTNMSCCQWLLTNTAVLHCLPSLLSDVSNYCGSEDWKDDWNHLLPGYGSKYSKKGEPIGVSICGSLFKINALTFELSAHFQMFPLPLLYVGNQISGLFGTQRIK